MPYITATDLLQTPGATELAQLATSESAAIVDAALLELTITDGDRTAYTADERADADAALARIEAVIAQTEQLVDGYLGARYALPLDPVPGILQTWAIDIARYRLNTNLPDHDQNVVYKRYRDALKFLAEVRDGKFSLGADDPVVNSADGRVRTSAPCRVFTTDTLADF